jgi:hypothetical protein
MKRDPDRHQVDETVSLGADNSFGPKSEIRTAQTKIPANSEND